MITFKSCTCVPLGLAKHLEKASTLLVEKLKLTEYTAIVELHLTPIDIQPTLQPYPTLPVSVTFGSIGPLQTCENEELIKTGKPPVEYDIRLVLQDPLEMLETLAHEILHLKQWVTGKLTVNSLFKPEKDAYFIFKGQKVLPTATNKPQEVEPKAFMVELGRWVGIELLQDFLKEATVRAAKGKVVPAWAKEGLALLDEFDEELRQLQERNLH